MHVAQLKVLDRDAEVEQCLSESKVDLNTHIAQLDVLYREEEAEKFRTLYESVDNYSSYALEYLPPMFEELRNQYKLHEGQTKFESGWSYSGELGENGKACGFGTATRGKESYKGHWINNAFEGIGKDKLYFCDQMSTVGVYTLASGNRWDGEWKNGKLHGKTSYYQYGLK